MSKATVIGVGNLGSCIAYQVANLGLVDELILVDIYRDLAEGNAADIEQALAFRSHLRVRSGDYKDAEGSDVIVVTAGKPRTPEMKSRIELLEVNKKIIQQVASNLKRMKNEPIVVTLTNPVDIMNFLMHKNTGFDRRRVLGSAGMLDSSRLRTVLSKRYSVSVLDVEAYVIGEHGDSQVPVFSQIRKKGKRMVFNESERAEIIEELSKSAEDVINKKGATIFAPTSNTVDMLQMILGDEKRTAVCSVVLEGEYGLKDVSIGVPIVLGRKGAERILEWELDEEERQSFYKGANYIKEVLNKIISS